MNVLFITRKFPPMKGGMEKVAHELYMHLSKITNVKLVKWGGSNKWLPLVLPYFLIKSFLILFTKKIDAIYLQDGLLSPLGLVLKMFRKPIAITIYGLDITYKNKLYQFLIPRCIKRLNKIICISQATKQECIKRKIPEEKITVIPPGISDKFYINEDKEVLKSELKKKLDLKLEDKNVLLSVGRLVKRKGFHWFVESVIPKLLKQRNDLVYLIAGDGTLRERIKNTIANNGLEDYVIMLGKVDDEALKLLYNASDILIMSNMPVEGDMEGFGIVALEAASCGLPVVASNLEGIRDSVIDGKNGFLVEPYDVNGFMDVITTLLENDCERKKVGKRAGEFTLQNYDWGKIAKKYLNIFKKAGGR